MSAVADDQTGQPSGRQHLGRVGVRSTEREATSLSADAAGRGGQHLDSGAIEAAQITKIHHDGQVALTVDEIVEHSREIGQAGADDLAVEGQHDRAERSADDKLR